MTDPLALRLLQRALTACLGDVIAAAPGPAGALKGLNAGLITAWAGWSLNLDPTTVTEYAGTGYARQPVVWGASTYIDGVGRSAVAAASLNFKNGDPALAAMIQAIGFWDALTAGNLLATAALPDPIAFSLGTESFEVAVKLAFPGSEAPDWGVGAVVF